MNKKGKLINCGENLWRRNGIYLVRPSVKINGQWVKREKSLETDSFATANLKKARVLAKIRAAAGSLLGGNLLLDECAEIYLENIRSTPRKGKLPKPEAVKYRASTIEGIRLLLPEFDQLYANEFSKDDAKSWAKRARQKSGSWFNGMLQSFRGLMQIAVDNGSISENPFDDVGQVEVINQPGTVYSFAQMEMLFAELKRRKDFAESQRRTSHAWFFCRFLYHFTLRLDTAAALTPGMADRNAMQFVIPGELVKGERTGSIIRGPIFPEMAALLDELDAVLGKKREFILPINGCLKVLRAACAAVKLPRLKHHDFRHIFTTHAILNGVPVDVLAKWLNHKDGGALLLKRYNHVFDEVGRDEAAKLKFRNTDEKIYELQRNHF